MNRLVLAVLMVAGLGLGLGSSDRPFPSIAAIPETIEMLDIDSSAPTNTSDESGETQNQKNRRHVDKV